MDQQIMQLQAQQQQQQQMENVRQWVAFYHQIGQLDSLITPTMRASLTPPSNDQRILGGVPFEEVPVKDPVPYLPVANDIAWTLTDLAINVTNVASGTATPVTVSWDMPASVYAITASVRTTDGGAFPSGIRTALDLFRIQFESANIRKFITAPVLGSTVCGTAERPRFLGRPCWKFNNGSTLQTTITPLANNLEINVVLWSILTPGPTNIAFMP